MILSITKHSFLLYILRAFAGSVILIFGMGVCMAISSSLTTQFSLANVKELLLLENYVSGADTFFTIEFVFLSSLLYGFGKYVLNHTVKQVIVKELVIFILTLTLVIASTFYAEMINITSKFSYLSYFFITVSMFINLFFIYNGADKIDLFNLFYRFIKISIYSSLLVFTLISILNSEQFQFKNLVLFLLMILHCFFSILANSFLNFLFIKSYYNYEKN
jgi:hypothetical protein